jgi:ABC-2 type transport system permease protein
MERTQQRRCLFFLDPTRQVFSFFFSYGRRARRTKVFYLLSLFPALIAAVIKISQFFVEDFQWSGMRIFSDMAVVFYLQFFMLILALFFGTSVCSEEVEGKTLTYLTTRPIPKSSVIIGKYAAYSTLAVLMTVTGMAVSYFILNLDNLLNLSHFSVLFQDMGVMILGVVWDIAFFWVIGNRI